MKQIEEPARRIPVRAEVDVLVVGAGPAGLMAAQAAALEKGTKVMLVESRGFLGGNMTIGLPLLGFLWLPGYLRGMGEAQNLTHEQTLNMIQWIGGIPFLVGALGGILTSVWSDSMIKRGRSALSARKVMLMAVVVVAPLCAAVPYVGASETLSFAWRVGLVVAIFSLVAVMCLSWLYTLPVVLAETFPIKNVASVMGICCGAGALGSVVFNQFVGSIPSEAWYTLFAIMGTLHIIAAVVLWKMVRPESPETK